MIKAHDYHSLSFRARRQLRERYVKDQGGKCMHCDHPLDEDPPASITRFKIDWEAFPSNFLKNKVHLQHNHVSGLTEGAVHAYCNAVLWQYHGR